MNLMSQYLLTINFLNASAAGSAYEKTKEECPWIFPTEQHCRQWSSMLAEANTHDAVTMVLSHLPTLMKWWTCLGPALTNPPQSWPLSFSFHPKESRTSIHQHVQSINTSWSITVPCLQSQCLRHARFRGKVIDLAKIAVERGCFWHSLLPSTSSRNLLCKGILATPKKLDQHRKHSFHTKTFVESEWHFTFSQGTYGYPLLTNSRVEVVLNCFLARLNCFGTDRKVLTLPRNKLVEARRALRLIRLYIFATRHSDHKLHKDQMQIIEIYMKSTHIFRMALQFVCSGLPWFGMVGCLLLPCHNLPVSL